jgi:hypothetical protein
MDKTALLNRLYANRMLFEQTISQVRETSMLDQTGPDQHTGKDIIAHPTAWEQRVVRWLSIAAQGQIPYSPEPGATWDDMDRLNEQTLAQNKDRSLQEVKADSQRSFQELVEQIQAFSEEELAIPRPFAGPGKAIRQNKGNRSGNRSWQVQPTLTTRITCMISLCLRIRLVISCLTRRSCRDTPASINMSVKGC